MTAYHAPPGLVARTLNSAVGALTRAGIGLAGSSVLEVRGRRTGEWRSTPVNPLTVDGTRYLVAARGHTQWVRNLRATGEVRLVKGRRREELRASELPDDEKAALLRAYLKRWKWEVGAFFAGVGPDSTDEELRRIAPDHPVFRLSSRGGSQK